VQVRSRETPRSLVAKSPASVERPHRRSGVERLAGPQRAVKPEQASSYPSAARWTREGAEPIPGWRRPWKTSLVWEPTSMDPPA
jgi:hypothetical protein